MPAQSRKPNVIVFFTDQQRWDTTGLHGNPLGLTPNYDRLARQGTHLANFFTCQPVCGPARSCLQTGKHATTTGCYRNGIPIRDEKTLAHYFNAGGYTTGYIGKWHLGTTKGAVPKAERGGYEWWLGANALEAVSDSYDCVVFDNDDKEVKLPGYRVDALTDAAIRYIESPKEKPYFLFLSYLEPHHQNHLDDYPAPDGYRELYTSRWTPPDLLALGGTTQQHLAGYYGMVKRLDEALGRVYDVLKSRGELDNTILLFTSDHGCHFKTRNGEYKRSCHESSIRVPTFIMGPGFEAGGERQELISLLDLPPTLLDAAGLAVPTEMQGRSILPLVKRTGSEWPKEVLIQISESQVGRALRTARWKYSVEAPEKHPRDDAGSEKYVETFLYDLRSDPYELNNLAGFESHKEVAAILRQRLVKQMVAAGEKEPVIEPAASRPSKQHRVRTEEGWE